MPISMMKFLEDTYKLNAEDVMQKLHSSIQSGLSEEEVADRLQEYGTNELEEKRRKSPWRMLFDQFTETMVLILIAAAVVSGFLGKEIETIAIAAIVVLFAILGFVQEYRAEKAMLALKQLAVPLVKVLRRGKMKEISAKLLVPGDIIYMEAGNIVPADVRIVETANLKIQEATLTGESVPVDKKTGQIDKENVPLGDRINMAYMGTTVTLGRGKAIVVKTGMQTELGKIASMIQDVETERTPLQNRLDQLGKWLAIAGGFAALLVLAVGLFMGESFSEMFLVGISVAVAVVPEGLPAVVTITLALGSQKMLKQNALIRKLPAVETLGSVTVICSDKTGTLTENRMTVVQLETAGECLTDLGQEAVQHSDNVQLNLLIGTLCNDTQVQAGEKGSEEVMGEPTEVALVEAALKGGLLKNNLEQDMPRVAEVPFDSDRMRMSTIHKPKNKIPGLADFDSQFISLSKGAVESLLKVSSKIKTQEGIETLSQVWIERIRKSHDEMAAKGLRVLGLAYKPLLSADENNLTENAEQEIIFLGMAGMIDPPRAEVKPAVSKCISAGIRPVMITGDYPLTAMAIAGELGIPLQAEPVTSQQITNFSQEELNKKVNEVSVFARVAPQDKLSIVTSLQAQGEIVAMTGDGVNDSPALKKANIGVAMGITGTDVSKEASDMVLLDDNFSTIVTAVEEGRSIYDNLLRFVKYSLGGNLGKVLIMLLAPFFGIIVALSPLQLLWLNLLTDGLMGLGLGVEPAEKDIMNKPPRSPKAPILNKSAVAHISWVGIVIALLSLGIGVIYFDAADPENPYWQTMVFATVGFTQIGHAFGLRATSKPVFSLTSNKLFTIMAISTLILQLSVIYVPLLDDFFSLVPLAMSDLAIAVGAGVLVLIAVQIERRYFKRV